MGKGERRKKKGGRRKGEGGGEKTSICISLVTVSSQEEGRQFLRNFLGGHLATFVPAQEGFLL